MLLIDFLSWWYTGGWRLRFVSIFRNTEDWLDYFSIGTLLKTLFSPWKQNVSYTRPDQSLDAKMNALTDNLVSRFVGFFVRIGVLIAAIVTVSILFALNIVFAIIWPLLPFTSIGIIIFGFVS